MSGMNNNNYGKAYQERVQRLFDRVNNIQSITKEEKQLKIHDLEKIVKELEGKIKSHREEKKDKISNFKEAIKELQKALEAETAQRENLENNLNSEINHLEKNCSKILEEARMIRDETDTTLVSKLNNSIDLLQDEISKNLVNNTFEEQKELDQLIETDIPKLQYELANESSMRKELENKIMEQFMEQIQELNTMFIDEKKKRELKEEEILNGINTISNDIEQSLLRQKHDREKNEENILELIEKVIERLKNDISEY